MVCFGNSICFLTFFLFSLTIAKDVGNTKELEKIFANFLGDLIERSEAQSIMVKKVGPLRGNSFFKTLANKKHDDTKSIVILINNCTKDKNCKMDLKYLLDRMKPMKSDNLKPQELYPIGKLKYLNFNRNESTSDEDDDSEDGENDDSDSAEFNINSIDSFEDFYATRGNYTEDIILRKKCKKGKKGKKDKNKCSPNCQSAFKKFCENYVCNKRFKKLYKKSCKEECKK